jgi:hypothetical protein
MPDRRGRWMGSTLALAFAEVSDGGLEHRPAGGLVALVGHWQAVDSVVRIAFGDGAIVMALPGATAKVTEARYRDALDGELDRADAHDFATIAGWIVQSDNFTHG